MTDKAKGISEEVDDDILLESNNDNLLNSVNSVDDEIVGIDGVIVSRCV